MLGQRKLKLQLGYTSITANQLNTESNHSPNGNPTKNSTRQ